MKTNFLSFGLFSALIFALFVPKLNATEIERPSNYIIPIYVDGDNFPDSDSPYGYAARIKRFHRPYQGFDYFSPAYVDLNSYSAISTLGITIYTGTPYEYSKFEDWNRLNSSLAIYKYYHDEFYRQRVDMWNRIYNPNWHYDKSPMNPFGEFNFSAGFGLTGNLNTLSNCAAWDNFYSYENLNNNNLATIIYGQNVLSITGKLVESMSPEVLKPSPPTSSTPFISKKVRTNTTLQSMKRSVLQKEDFYSHLTLRTPKRLPKNWRTLPSALRAWYESPDIAPPSATYYIDAIKYASEGKQDNRIDNNNYHHNKTSLPKTRTLNTAPKFEGSTLENKQSVKSSSRKSISRTNY